MVQKKKQSVTKPTVSVVIPCYNLGLYVEEALASVQAQTYADWEAIIVNDGSTDQATNEVLARLKTQAHNYIVIDQENKGLAGARNTGIARARGEYIVCLDADDVIEPSYLEDAFKTLKNADDERIAIATTWLQEFGTRDDLWKPSEYDVAKLLVNNCLHVASMYRRKLWEEIGGYKKGLGGYEDWDFWLSAAELGYRWTIIPRPLFRYRIRQNSMLADARKRHAQFFGQLYEYHADFYAKHGQSFTLAAGLQLAELHAVIAEKNAALARCTDLEKQVDYLQSALIQQGEKLNGLQNSRLIRQAIGVRRIAGNGRERATAMLQVLRRVSHAIRVLGAPYVPRPIRKVTKLCYRMVRLRTLSPYPKYIQIKNTAKPKSSPLVSIVLPYFNRADTIQDTIDSLAAQTLQDFEIILVDDGSTDPQSIAIIKEIERSSQKLRLSVVRQHNQGVAAARNTGIKRAHGKYVVCLDSDDTIEPTYLEKAAVMLEYNLDIGLVTTNQQMFGVINDLHVKREYDPLALYEDNMVITAAMFRKEAWKAAGGYNTRIGYEDWEYWLSLAEKGFWGKLIPEALFRYRTATISRYVDDKRKHWENVRKIRDLHPRFVSGIRAKLHKRALRIARSIPDTVFVNLNRQEQYLPPDSTAPNVLIAIPWMTFGGAETLIYNFCKEISGEFNISFVTGLPSAHEWEYKFREISPYIYHLPNLFDNGSMYLEFISNYVATRNIKLLHIIHTSFMYDMLAELKARHPDLKIISTVFNTRAEHFENSIACERYIDTFSTDNKATAQAYTQRLPMGRTALRISNGIDCFEKYNPQLFNIAEERAALNLSDGELGIFFIGRLSEEKNPDVFVAVARRLLKVSPQLKARFFIVGDGPIRPKLEKQIAAAKSDKVVYLGYQPQVAHYLAAADVFILPSSIEGFPLSILEAMAMEVAVIASDVGAVAEIITSWQDGVIVAPGSAREIIEAIEKLAKEPELLHELRRKARQSIEHKYSNKILGAKYTEMYRKQVR